MCSWPEVDMLWKLCCVICRLYDSGFEVVRESLLQAGLSRALYISGFNSFFFYFLGNILSLCFLWIANT